MARILDIFLLVVLLVIVGLRPLIGETYTSARDPVSAGMADLADPGTARTLAFDLAALIAGGAALMIGVVRRGRPNCFCGLSIGTVLLAVAAVVSCEAAGEKRPAINAALDWIAALVSASALVRLLDQPWKIALTVLVIVAGSLVNVADCVDDALSAARTREQYLEQRDRIWAEQGVPLDAPQVTLFERRLAANEASGFFAHSNIAGAYLLLGLFASLGLANACGRRRIGGCALGGALACACACGVVLTRGTGALLAAMLGLFLLAARGLCADFLSHRRRGVFIGAWIAVALAILAVCGHGWYHGTLPHPSLAFRWQYWTASSQMFLDHPITGVGAENFGHHYTAYKPITSPEEVKNPHNLLVQAATEYGLPGLIAIGVLLVAGAWRATQPVPKPAPAADSWLTAGELRRVFALGLFCAAAIFLLRVPLLESGQPAFVFWMTGFGLLIWLAGFGIAIAALAQVPAARARTGLAVCGSVGLLVFLVQEMINFAMFVPAPRMTFLALFAVVVSLRAAPVAEMSLRSGRGAAGALAMLALFAAATCVWQLRMVVPAQRALHTARSMPAISDTAGMRALREAYQRTTAADPYDAIPPAEEAQWQLRVATTHPSLVPEYTAPGLAAIAEAIARSPHAFSLRLRQAQLHLLRGRALRDPAEFDFAVAAAREALRLYPQHPRNHVALGECLRAVETCAAVAEAAIQFQQALDLDDQRPQWEVIRRFSPRERAEIGAHLAEAEAFVAAQCATDD